MDGHGTLRDAGNWIEGIDSVQGLLRRLNAKTHGPRPCVSHAAGAMMKAPAWFPILEDLQRIGVPGLSAFCGITVAGQRGFPTRLPPDMPRRHAAVDISTGIPG